MFRCTTTWPGSTWIAPHPWNWTRRWTSWKLWIRVRPSLLSCAISSAAPTRSVPRCWRCRSALSSATSAWREAGCTRAFTPKKRETANDDKGSPRFSRRPLLASSMTGERWTRIEQLFHELADAAEAPPAEDVVRLCGSDQDLAPAGMHLLRGHTTERGTPSFYSEKIGTE